MKRHPWLILSLFCCLPGLLAQTIRFSEVGSWGDPAYRDVAYMDGYAFALGPHELVIFDVADPVKPVRVGSLANCDNARYVTARASRLYLIGAGHIRILDMVDPQQPQEIGRTALAVGSWRKPFFHEHVFVSPGTYGFEPLLIDLSDPEHPQQRFLPPGIGDVLALADGQIHLDDYGTYRVLDLQGTVLSEGESPFTNPPRLMLVQDGLVYTLEDRTLRIYAPDDAAGLVEIGQLPLETGYDHMRIDTGIVYLSDRSDPLIKVDVSDPANPVAETTMEVTDAFEVHDGIVYHVNDGLVTYDARANPPVRLNVEDVQAPGTIRSMLFDGNHLLVAHYTGGLRILKPENGDLRLVSTADVSYISHLDLYGDTLLVSGDRTRRVDLSDPEHPEVYSAPGGGGDIQSIASGLFEQISGLTFYTHEGSYVDSFSFNYVDGVVFGMTARDEWLYVGEQGLGVFTVDVDREWIRSVHGQAGPSSTYEMVVAGDLLATASSEKGVTLYGLENPARPLVRSRYPHVQAHALLHSGDHLYVGEGRGLSVLDIQNPDEPRLIGTHTFPAPVTALEMADGRIYAATGDRIRILEIDEVGYESVIPWVVATSFTSRVSVYNLGAAATNARFRAMDDQGRVEEQTIAIAAGGSYTAASADLFPELSGYSLVVSASQPIHTDFLTLLHTGEGDFASPSKTTGTAITDLTSDLLFAHLPWTGGAVVLTAPTTHLPSPVLKITLFGSSGGILAERDLRLEGNQPKAIMLADLFDGLSGEPPQDATLRVHAADGVNIAGTGFAFSPQGHPSMATAFSLPASGK